MFSTAPPGYPNTMSTPRSSSALTNISATVIFMSFPSPDHGPGARRAHQLGVPCQIPRPDFRRRGLPGFLPADKLGRRDVQRELPLRNVQDDLVPVLHEGDRPPLHRLRGHVADARSVRPSGEPPVGDESHPGSQPHLHDRRRGGKKTPPPPPPPPPP